MRRILRALIRAVLESEAAALRVERDAWRARAECAEAQLVSIASLRPDSRVERSASGFIAHVVSSTGSRHTGTGLTAADAIRASGA